MYDIKKIIVALDLSNHDRFLIKYILKGLKHNDKLEDVYFLHIVRDYQSPKLKERFPETDSPIDEQIKTKINQEIKEFGEDQFPGNIHVEVHEGDVAKTILKWAEIKNADLIVLGKKYDRKHIEETPKYITKLAKCSVLIVPDHNPPTNIDKIVVAIDFSDLSAHAIKQAIAVSNMIGQFTGQGPKLQLVNVYEVPSGYHTTGKSFEEFGDIIKENHKKEYAKFIKKNNLDEASFPCDFLLDEHSNTSKRIALYAKETHARGIVIGSKGRTHLASMLLGSVAENLLSYNHEIPFAVIKDKTDNYDFFDAIMRL
ncbi:universal stress protein [Aureibacter tunicatorum]|uniref:Nucleotide-binding universal stress UspA family protein n=1 Tax=Aureibacter tunicatorum TaxID=866807 RepID=A0AAE3XLN3_9BACT|nr:universal stress protein [Aureibacter tunicatorum]MDR6237229.1 nucleotide-binding universal stress UspA family protein [Aureibacter tunicatorum]BDD06221.1 universal stress protein [Aureibacter tunicatorum]